MKSFYTTATLVPSLWHIQDALVEALLNTTTSAPTRLTDLDVGQRTRTWPTS